MSPDRFKKIREQLGLTQDELANVLGISGKRPISRYETGERTPDLLTQALMSLLESLPERESIELMELLADHMKKVKRQQKSSSNA